MVLLRIQRSGFPRSLQQWLLDKTWPLSEPGHPLPEAAGGRLGWGRGSTDSCSCPDTHFPLARAVGAWCLVYTDTGHIIAEWTSK